MPRKAAVNSLAQEAERERARREKARRDSVAFSQYVDPNWKAEPHHILVGQYLNQVKTFVETGGQAGIGRLMVFEPPRHGKTTQVAQHFPAWALGGSPNWRLIIAAYVAELAQRSSRAIRNLLMETRYQAVFGELSAVEQPVTLADDSRSVGMWDLAAPHKGGLVAAGVRGGLTGYGANIGLIDDPFKNREEAESEKYRESVWEWYGSSFYTRLEAHAAVVITHTRWHPEDLAGKLLKAQTQDPLADTWTVLCLPAIAPAPEELAVDEAHQAKELAAGLWLNIEDPLKRAPGTALWSGKYDAAALRKIKANLDGANPLDWPALYQQQPRPVEGVFFKREHFRVIERGQLPQGLKWVRYCDLAISEKKTADFNTSAAVALGAEATLFVRDMIRVRGWSEFKARLIEAMLSPEEKGTIWLIEDTAFQALAFQELMADKRLVGVAIRAVRPETDKVTRARPLQTRGDVGKVLLVNGPWVTAFIAEAVEFPTGRHDDQIDTVTGGMGELAKSVAEVRVRTI